MNIVYTVRSDSPQAPPLTRLIDQPREHLGLDVWQVQADHIVLRAAEEQAARLRQMGYTIEEVVETESHIAMFASAEAIAAYHSAETLESNLHQLAESQTEIAELRVIGRSVEDRPIWALDACRSRSEDFSHPVRSWHSEHSFVGFDGGEGGFEQPYSIAVRSWEKMEDPSAMFQRVSQLLHTVAQELQEPDHVLMPYEHCNAG